MRTILLAADGSPSSRDALKLAVELAKATGATLEIVSVRPLGTPARGAPGWAVGEEAVPERIAADAAASARAAGVDARAHGMYGDVVASIGDAAASLHADLLVIGSRGAGSASGATLGSVSNALVRRSRVPVTVVRHVEVPAGAASRA
jgi:nucleotide-binding universal stress UspA family protein